MVDNLDRRGGAARLQISRHREDHSLEGKTLAAVAQARGKDPIDAAIEIVDPYGSVAWSKIPAALRRFTFKVKFDFLTPVQSAAAYRQFFGCEPPVSLRSVEHLTPGDFAIVAKKLRLLGQLSDGGRDIVRLLEQEVAAKNLRTVKIGF